MRRLLILGCVVAFTACNNTVKVESQLDTLSQKLDTAINKAANSALVDSVEAKGGRLIDSTKIKGGRLWDSTKSKGGKLVDKVKKEINEL